MYNLYIQYIINAKTKKSSFYGDTLLLSNHIMNFEVVSLLKHQISYLKAVKFHTFKVTGPFTLLPT